MTQPKSFHSSRIRPPLIIAGQFPPPVNGFAYITQEMAKALAVSHETKIIDLAPHYPKNGVPYHLRRLTLTLKGLWPLLRFSLNKNYCFYMACESQLGLMYNLILCAAARLLRYPLYIHYHNFNFIDGHSQLMALLLRISGKKTRHIFLCKTMAERFTARYQIAIKSIILSNSAFVESVPSPPRNIVPNQPLVVGLLSNLNNGKGLDLFLDLVRSIAQQGLNIRGVLAGPAQSDVERAVITAACTELEDRLEYRGAVYGQDKEDFYRTIDVFVFPSRYEAQPTVLFEAQAYGIPAITYNRGCIYQQVGACGLVIPQEEDFVALALSWLKEQLEAPGALTQLKIDTQISFMKDREQALHKISTLIELET